MEKVALYVQALDLSKAWLEKKVENPNSGRMVKVKSLPPELQAQYRPKSHEKAISRDLHKKDKKFKSKEDFHIHHIKKALKDLHKDVKHSLKGNLNELGDHRATLAWSGNHTEKIHKHLKELANLHAKQKRPTPNDSASISKFEDLQHDIKRSLRHADEHDNNTNATLFYEHPEKHAKHKEQIPETLENLKGSLNKVFTSVGHKPV